MRLFLHAGPIDLVRGVQLRADGEVALTSLEVRLLEVLSGRPGGAFTRDELLSEVWGHDPRRTVTRAVDVAVRRLRSKVERDPRRPEHVRTVAGGYGFVPLADGPPATALHHRGRIVDLEAARVHTEAGDTALGPRDVAILRALAAGAALGEAALHQAAWGAPLPSSSRAVELAVGRLRRRVELDPARPTWVLGSPRTGWRVARPGAADWEMLLATATRAIEDFQEGRGDRLAWVDAARPLLSAPGDPGTRARAASILAVRALLVPDVPAALAILEAALPDAAAAPSTHVDLIACIANAHLQSDRLVAALGWLDVGIDVAARHGLADVEAWMRTVRGDIHVATGRVGEALADLDAAIERAVAHGLPRREGMARVARSHLYVREGRWGEAADESRRAMQILDGVDAGRAAAMGRLHAATALADAGAVDEAVALLEPLAAVARGDANDDLVGYALVALARIDHAGGRLDAARARCVAALGLAGAGPALGATARVALAALDIEEGRDTAVEHLSAAAPHHASLPHRRVLGRLLLAAALVRGGGAASARSVLAEGLVSVHDARVSAIQAILAPVLAARCGVEAPTLRAPPGEPIEAAIAKRLALALANAKGIAPSGVLGEG